MIVNAQEQHNVEKRKETEEPLSASGQTVLILPNVSPTIIEKSSLKQSYNQLSVLAAIAVHKGLNVLFPRFITAESWNVELESQAGNEVDKLIEMVDHIWCIGFWTKGVRLEFLKVAAEKMKPITFLNWDALNSSFVVEDKQTFQDNEEATEASQDETAFAWRYLQDNDPMIEEIMLGIPRDTISLGDEDEEQPEPEELRKEADETPKG